MKPKSDRRKGFFAIITVLAIISFGTVCWAVPIGPYDFSVTVGSSYETAPILLGASLTFDSWWDIYDPVNTGSEPWATVYIQRPDATFGYVTLQAFYNNTTSTSWATEIIDTSAYAGQTLKLLFSIDDYGYQSPDPIYYVRNFPSNNDAHAVPEPSTLLLLGSGLVGLVGFGRRRMRM